MKLTFMQAIARQERGWGTPTYNDPRHNPGDIEDGIFAQTYGALPSDGNRFARFPNEEIGFAAMKSLLTLNYAGMTVFKAICKYAPAAENDDVKYVKNVCNWTGLTSSTVLTPELIG